MYNKWTSTQTSSSDKKCEQMDSHFSITSSLGRTDHIISEWSSIYLPTWRNKKLHEPTDTVPYITERHGEKLQKKHWTQGDNSPQTE